MNHINLINQNPRANHNSEQQADLTIIPQAWYNIIKWYDWISIQIHKKANPHRVAAPWGFFYAVAVLWVLFLVSIQPFANVVSNYTCFNREKKWYDYLHDSSPPSAYGRRRTAYILYHLTRKSSRIAIKPFRIVSEEVSWFIGKVYLMKFKWRYNRFWSNLSDFRKIKVFF